MQCRAFLSCVFREIVSYVHIHNVAIHQVVILCIEYKLFLYEKMEFPIVKDTTSDMTTLYLYITRYNIIEKKIKRLYNENVIRK